jgi:hypothetical protein
VLFILAGSVGLGAIVVESGLAAILARSIEQVSPGNTAAGCRPARKAAAAAIRVTVRRRTGNTVRDHAAVCAR